MLRRLIAAMLVLASGCFAPAPLVAQGIPATIDSVRAYAVGPAATLDSVAARSRRDTTVRTIRNGMGVVIWLAPATRFKSLLDSLPRWCTAPCAWDWDSVIEIRSDTTASPMDAMSQAEITPGLVAVGAPAACAMGPCGDGVKVAVLDSGIDIYHPDLTVVGGYNAVTRVAGDFNDDLGVCNGHGTHIAGTIAAKPNGVGVVGVAPAVQLYAIKVFENIGGRCLAYTTSQIVGLNWAVTQGIRLVSVSIGSTGSSYSYDLAMQAAADQGTYLIAAAGNNGGAMSYPGYSAQAIAVGALDGANNRAGFSNFGPELDFAAPGVGITSTMPGGGYGGKSGTSMATPHVVGVAALILAERPALTRDGLRQALRDGAIDLEGPGFDNTTGWGLVRADRSIAAQRGGVAIAAPAVDTIVTAAPLPAQTCKPVVALGSWTATANVPWIRVTTTPDSLCYAIDPALVPRGASTVTGTITWSMP